jgi:Fe-S oxidoreductase
MRWEAEKYLEKRHPFPVLTIVELIDRYLQTGRIQLKKDVVEGPITFHDPCNIGRRGGVIQAPRNILKELTSQYVEMHPHGARNFCCGGGGGLGASTDYAQKRIEMGKTKVEQIRQTGAKVVATGCFNCMTQIRDLIKAYEMGVEVKSIVELVADALNS